LTRLKDTYHKIVIIGGGESGVGAAILAKKQNKDVFLSDGKVIKESYKNELQNHQIEFEENKHSFDRILEADVIVKSPGVAHKLEVIQKAIAKGIPIISEIEYGYWYNKAKLIGITGSNGKTTTTSLTYHLFKEAGLNVGLAGNIGKSFAKSVAEDNFDYYILEVSSFQLDDIIEYRNDVSVLLNITPDHLDRYNYQFENYIQAKFNIFKNSLESDKLLYCLDDEVICNYLAEHKEDIKGQLIPFTLANNPQEDGAWFEGDEMNIALSKKIIFSMDINEILLKGSHNRHNSMAAGLSAKIEGIRNQTIKEAMRSFKTVDHRLDLIATIKEVDFINDSKATNVNSVWVALETIKTPIIWLAGGTDKGNDYSTLMPFVRERVRFLICIGDDNTKLIESFKDELNTILEIKNMQEAVKTAFEKSLPGDTVLLSPACASFDLYNNFEDRGEHFKAAVQSLSKTISK